ncbi:site-2 protease family protein [Thermosipho ferrireducens]|uniref:Site-2 protease family protein n=1 Tax=Thermosipho ferrireducens TaxID=2571116 RepID=A0ABX7S7T2_9BACT|nr:site-2 protease family protein [Thermosipho ferrireducens]QTA37338.1 site-2 protease family protein [Thermosipho ferrireducens]
MVNIVGKVFENLAIGFVAVILVVYPREYFKAYIITRFGDDTPKKLGRLSLNPLVHLDPIGTIAFIMFNFGWSRPVPVIPMRLKNPRKALLIISVFGPILGAITFIVYGIIAKRVENYYLFSTFYRAAKWSLTYALLSLFPIPPLDGSRILGVILPEKYIDWYIKYEVYGVLFLLGLLLLWVLPLIMSPFINVIESLTNFIIYGG